MSDYDVDKDDTLQRLANTISFVINDEEMKKYGFSLVIFELKNGEYIVDHISDTGKEEIIEILRKEADHLESNLPTVRKH